MKSSVWHTALVAFAGGWMTLVTPGAAAARPGEKTIFILAQEGRHTTRHDAMATAGHGNETA